MFMRQRKRIVRVSICLVATTLCLSISESALAANSDLSDVFTEDGIAYTVVSEGAVNIGAQSVAGDNWAGSGELVVPEAVMHDDVTYTVTGVNPYAFSNGSSGAELTSISLPSTVTQIGQYAFFGCASLESLTFAVNSQLESVKGMAFANCSSLKSVNVPASVVELGQFSFANCASLTDLTFESPEKTAPSLTMYANAFRVPEGSENSLEELQLPARLGSVPARAFEYRNALKCVSFAEAQEGTEINNIGESAFNGCSGLTELVLPRFTAESNAIGRSAFFGAANLETIVFLYDEDYGLTDDSFAIGYGERVGLAQGYQYPAIKSLVYYGSHVSSLFPDANHYDHVRYYLTKEAAETVFASAANVTNGSGDARTTDIDANGTLNEDAIASDGTDLIASVSAEAQSDPMIGEAFVRDDISLYDLSARMGGSDEKGAFIYSGSVPSAGVDKCWCYPGASLTNGTNGPVEAYPVAANDLSAGEIVLQQTEIPYRQSPVKVEYDVIDASGSLLVEGDDYKVIVRDSIGSVVNNGDISTLGSYIVEASANGSYIGSLRAMFSVVNPTCVWTRLSGNAAYSTPGHMQESAFPAGSVDNLILVGKSSLTLAAAAGGLAGVRSAPIAVTDDDALSAEARYLIGYYHPISVILLGIEDVDAVSASIRQILGANASISSSFDASSAAETAANLYLRTKRSGSWDGMDTALVAPSDDIVSASLAGSHGFRTTSPVFLTDSKTGLPESIISEIANNFSKVIFVGLDSASVESLLGQLSGSGFSGASISWNNDNPYDLSADIAAEEIANEQSGYDDATIVSAYDTWGLVSAISTCGKNKAPLLIADDDSDKGFSAIDRIVTPNSYRVEQGYLFGARRFLSAEFEERVAKIWNDDGSSDLLSTTVLLDRTSFDADGKGHLPIIDMTDKMGKVLSQGVDYTSSCYANATDKLVTDASGPSVAGSYTLVLAGMGEYTGQRALTFTIGSPDISSASFIVHPESMTYTGSPIKPVVRVLLGDLELFEGKEFSLDFTDNVYTGIAHITAMGRGIYSGSTSTTFTILDVPQESSSSSKDNTGDAQGGGDDNSSNSNAGSRNLDAATIVLSTSSYPYNGSVRKPNVSVSLDGTSLKSGRDFTVSIRNVAGAETAEPKNAGTYMIIVSGTGDYQGSLQTQFTITKATQKIKTRMSKATYKLKQLRNSKNGGSFRIGAKASTSVKYSVNKRTKKAGVSVTKAGKVRVAKTCKKGKYIIKVKAIATTNYKQAAKSITVRVK